MNAQLRLVTPNNENRSVPTRPANAELRTREYLTPAEVEKLIKEARQGRYGHRDATLILIAFRHGLRASEICDLEWSQVEFGRSAALHVRRVKSGKPSVHPLRTRSEHYVRFADNSRIRALYLQPNAADRSRPMRLTGTLNGLASALASISQYIATCFATAAATHWPMPDTTHGLSRIGLAIAAFSTRSAIPN
jgi:integrase